jgi:hypothetical protein
MFKAIKYFIFNDDNRYGISVFEGVAQITLITVFILGLTFLLSGVLTAKVCA